jgi:hypothetical protein
MALGRRAFLQSVACAACVAAAGDPASGQAGRIFDGCKISSAGYNHFRGRNEGINPLSAGIFARHRHWRTTGDRAVDRDLDRALGITADLLGVRPAFGFYDPAYLHNPVGFEQDPWNAFATSENTDIAGTRGTVAFSINLFRNEFYNHDPSGVSLMTIVAHEFGHIVQYESGQFSSLDTGFPRKSEINADFLSGYFLGSRKRLMKSMRFQKAGEMLLRFGRPNNGNPQRSHGDERERIDAAEAGFRVAYVENRPLAQAVRAGMEYVGL